MEVTRHFGEISMPPRPRPRFAQAASQSQSSSESVPIVKDDDSRFIRNVTRDAKSWKEIEKITKAPPKPADESSEEEEDSDSPKQKKRRLNGKSKGKDRTRGGLNKVDQMLRLASSASEHESDDDLEILDTPARLTKANGSPSKRRKSRSRSITPPPALPDHILQNARNVVRDALARPHRPTSPAFRYNDSDDDLDGEASTDTVMLDPELQRIQREVRASSESRVFPESPQTNKDDTVLLKVRWKPHPLNEHGKEKLSTYRSERVRLSRLPSEDDINTRLSERNVPRTLRGCSRRQLHPPRQSLHVLPQQADIQNRHSQRS
jgi:hypothetical protein